MQDMFDAWIKDGVRRTDGNAELKRLFRADVLPAIGTLRVREISEHALRDVLRTLVARDVNRTTVIIRNSLTQMFHWAKKRQPWRKLLVDGNPMDLIEIEKIVSPDYDLNNERERVLSAGEIRELHGIFQRMQAECNDAPNKRTAVHPVEKTLQRAIWIMLSTLCRVGELSMARWEHVDFNAGEWFLPKGNVKGSHDALTVYLSAFALDQPRQLHELTSHSE